MRKKWLGAAFVVLGTCLAGCAGGYRYGYASYGPPAPRYERLGVAPGPGYLWVDGYWGWRGGRYAWVPGYWRRPPRAGAVWVRPEWHRDGDRWRLREGRWR